MKLARLILLHLVCLPADLLALVLGPLLFVRRFDRLVRRGRVLWIHIDNDMKGRAAITFGPHVVISDQPATATLIEHEHTHVEQGEAACIAMLASVSGYSVRTTLPPWWLALALMASAHLMFHGAGYLTAWLRGESAYRGSVNEEAARHAAGQE